jgi:predicted small lipoprotein YifL
MLALMPRRRLLVLAAFAALLASAAGCGDDGPREVSASELVAKGDARCEEGRQRFAEIQQTALRNANDAADQTRDLIDAANDELNDLRDLVPPDELADAYDAYLDSRVRAIEVMKQGLDAAERDDDKAYVDAQARAAAGAASRTTLAEAVGFMVCSVPEEQK